eukprot:TRINITY_DN74335_c0_g1_i1.p1 TRINITY_DN74335_c0_g1~~TRINITY_DN74335_c0_g1_i1.p1  ORF type:complete len:414 (-),score=77.26 TRINITY_DN74335_c0_g1_i1:15-1256(-)
MVGKRGSWLTLGAFAYNAAANAVMFMNFVVVSELSAGIFSVEASSTSLTYSVGLLTALPCTFVATYFLQRRSGITFFASVLLDVLGAWLRWLSVLRQSFVLCLASTVCIGSSFAICCMAFAVIGERWFREDQQVLATSLGVQSNYAGWCAGALAIPSLVHTEEDLRSFLLVQAIAVSLGLVLFALFHDEASAKPLSGHAAQPLESSLSRLARNQQYLVQLACYATLGAISYAVPGVQDGLFSVHFGWDQSTTRWTNLAFIAAGVVNGIYVGTKAATRPLLLLKVHFVAAAAALIVVQAALQRLIPESCVFVAVLLAMALAGAASLGFLGVALAAIAKVVPEVNEAYSAGAVEWFVQLGGAVLTETAGSARGFGALTSLAGLAAATLVLFGREDAHAQRTLKSAGDDIELRVST